MTPKCGRCLQETSMFIMSKFNKQDLCANCKETEEKHVDYPRADEAELQAVKAGVMNYPGIGLPKDLRAKLVDTFMDKKEDFFRDVPWNRFDGGYEIEPLADAGSDDCELCAEPLKGSAVRLSNFDDMMYACVRCADLVLVQFQKTIAEFLAGIDNDRNELAKIEGKSY